MKSNEKTWQKEDKLAHMAYIWETKISTAFWPVSVSLSFFFGGVPITPSFFSFFFQGAGCFWNKMMTWLTKINENDLHILSAAWQVIYKFPLLKNVKMYYWEHLIISPSCSWAWGYVLQALCNIVGFVFMQHSAICDFFNGWKFCSK